MSLLVDAPWLTANGYLIAKVSPNEKVERALELVIDATFLAVSVPMYLNAKWTEPVWTPTGSASGRDWMINSQVFTFDHDRPSWKTHAISAAIFATYPLWLRLGLTVGRNGRIPRSRSRRRCRGGLADVPRNGSAPPGWPASP